MNIQFYERVKDEPLLEGVWQLLCKYDHEFIPPLSARESTYQSELNSQHAADIAPHEYFNNLKQQSFLLATIQDTVVGFMSFRKPYVCEDLHDYIETIYITTIIVDQRYRGQGITTKFYHEIFRLAEAEQLPITTRTWSTNTSHISLVNKLGLKEIKRIENGRGPNIDTVYYRIMNSKGTAS